MDNRLAVFIFFFLGSISPPAVCLYTARMLYAHAPSLLLEYDLKRVESLTLDPFGRKYSEMMPRKTKGKRLFWYVWTWCQRVKTTSANKCGQ